MSSVLKPLLKDEGAVVGLGLGGIVDDRQKIVQDEKAEKCFVLI